MSQTRLKQIGPYQFEVWDQTLQLVSSINREETQSDLITNAVNSIQFEIFTILPQTQKLSQERIQDLQRLHKEDSRKLRAIHSFGRYIFLDTHLGIAEPREVQIWDIGGAFWRCPYNHIRTIHFSSLQDLKNKQLFKESVSHTYPFDSLIFPEERTLVGRIKQRYDVLIRMKEEEILHENLVIGNPYVFSFFGESLGILTDKEGNYASLEVNSDKVTSWGTSRLIQGGVNSLRTMCFPLPKRTTTEIRRLGALSLEFTREEDKSRELIYNNTWKVMADACPHPDYLRDPNYLKD